MIIFKKRNFSFLKDNIKNFNRKIVSLYYVPTKGTVFMNFVKEYFGIEINLIVKTLWILIKCEIFFPIKQII